MILTLTRNKSAIFILSVLFFVVASTSSAQSIFTKGLGGYPGSAFDISNFINLLSNLTCYLIRFAIISIFVTIVAYGILFLKSRGVPQEFSNVKRSLIFGMVGALVIFGVFTIILSISNILGVDYPILTIVQC